MPNQPKTPARTFRLSDETITKVDAMSAALGAANRSEAIRAMVDMSASMADMKTAITGFAEEASKGIPEGLTVEALAEAQVTVEAFVTADEAGWINVHMPTDEANRRLLAALSAARPLMVEEAVRIERQRTLRDVIRRVEGYEVPPLLLDHLKSLLD